MPFKVSFFLSQQGDRIGGWSENFWNQSASLSAAATEAAVVVGLLQATKGAQTFVNSVRISDVANFRSTQILTVSSPAPIGPVGSFDSDYQTTGALVRISTAVGTYTQQWFKGNPDVNVQAGGRWQPVGAWITAFGALTGRLNTGINGWCIRKLDTTQQKYLILAISQTGILTVAATNFTVGSNVKIRVSRVGGFAINALWNANVISATSLQLIGYVPPATPPVYTGGKGTVQLQSFVYTGIGTLAVVRATEHKVGRPFGQLIGRRKRRLLLGAG